MKRHEKWILGLKLKRDHRFHQETHSLLVPFDMLMRHRIRNLGSTNSAIIYIKVFLKAGFGAVTFTKRSIWLPILHSYVQPGALASFFQQWIKYCSG